MTGFSEKALEVVTEHLQTQWAGPYMARIRDFTPEEVKAGALAAADREAEAMAKEEAARALAVAHDPALGLDRSVRLGDVVEALENWADEHAQVRREVIYGAADFIVARFASPDGGER